MHHFIPEDGTGLSIARDLLQVVFMYDIERTLKAILADGCGGKFELQFDII